MGQDQAEVIAFLANPANHGDGSAAVERLTTHISELFLVGERAYKLKRAVTLPFLDFTKLADRAHFCQAEFGVNVGAAPMLYRGVRAITRDATGALVWDGDGEVVDWVIEMNRFADDGLFDRLAERGALTTTHIRDLADLLVHLQDRAAPTPDFGGRAGIAAVIASNRASFAPFAPALFDPAALADLSDRSGSWLDRLSPLLEHRRLTGKVRRCHGDLHLGNICLIDGRGVPFDAIEFSDSIACIDIAYDLAFLVMDLHRRGLAELAALLLSRCLAGNADIESLAALPLFLSLRAAIRAHIAAAMGKLDLARTLLAYARARLHPPLPRLVAIGGLSGTGKSQLARCLAPDLGAAPGALVLRSDELRKLRRGVSPETRLPPEAYDEQVTAEIYAEMLRRAGVALAAGHAVILDAVFARPEQRQAVVRLAAERRVDVTGLWLAADPETLRRRIADRRNNASDATPMVLDRQLAYDTGSVDWHRLDSSGSKSATLAQARQHLAASDHQ